MQPERCSPPFSKILEKKKPMKAPNFLSTLTGLFAMPAAENPTVAMVEAAYRHHGVDWRYLTCEVAPEMLGDAVRGARAMGWAGFNCSLPHKVAVIEHLDGIGQSAEIIGAVNTVVRRGDQYIGENTDGKGFIESLKGVFEPQGKKVIVFGAGGAARAVGVELALAGAAAITIVNRSRERGQVLVDLLNKKTGAAAELREWDQRMDIPTGTNLVVNATSIGLYPDVDARLNLNTDTLSPDMLVADIIPNPPQTNLLRDAKKRGCTVLDGLGMLVNQGVIGIKYWTGVDVDASVMRKALEEIF
jgi:shikimate dehydrogenase